MEDAEQRHLSMTLIFITALPYCFCRSSNKASPRVLVGDLRLVKLNKKTTFFVLNVSGRFPTTFLGNDIF